MFFYLISIPKCHFMCKKIIWSHDKVWTPRLVFPSIQLCLKPNYWSLTENQYYRILSPRLCFIFFMAFCHFKILCSFCTNLARLWRLNDISIFKKKRQSSLSTLSFTVPNKMLPLWSQVQALWLLIWWSLEAYMVVHFRARGISRGARKLARTPTLN